MSHAARQGFPKKRLRLIQNGISTDRFHRNEEARMQLRTAWDINENQCLIGLVARIDPLKDHEVFLQAASLSARRCSDMRFVCIGSGDAELLNKLKEQAAMLGLDSVLQWVDEYSDPVAIYNALDINTLVSKSEGFPNVVAEAMACGTPCVVTDVGDSREIVGETGKVCPSGSSEAVSEAWMQMRDHVKVYRERIADDCRNRVIQKFSQQQMVERHIQLFEQLV
jgi:glycosyltransferase involved in cell wall biosynthesis